MSLLNIGVSGLKSQQAALNIIGQNITNASTPGYTRQRAEIQTQLTSTAFGGSGVRVADVTRIADAFVDEQVRVDSSLSAELNSFTDRIGRLEGNLFDSRAGLDKAMREFFAALQEAGNEPADLARRDVVLNNAEGLADRFQGTAQQIWLLARDTATGLEAASARVNELSALIGGVNARIANLTDQETSATYNALLDQRETMLKELASQVSISVVDQSSGQINVFIGKGQPLVLGQDVAEVSVTGDGDVVLKPVGSGHEEIITASLTGGEIGGLLKFREEVLWPTQNELGRLAATLSTSFNDQHARGIDLEGTFGGPLFRDINDPALVGKRVDYLTGGGGSVPGLVNVYIQDSFTADPDDYLVHFSEENPGAYSVLRRSDGQVVHSGSTISIPQTIEFEGLSVEFVSGNFAPGESFLVRPYAGFAEAFSVTLTDPAGLALAAPVIADARTANNGTGYIQAEITDADHPFFAADQALVPPLLVEFVSDTEYVILDNSDPGRPVRMQPDYGTLSIVPGAENHLIPFAAGTSVVSASGPSLSRIQMSDGYVNDLQPLENGYPSGSLSVAYESADYPDQTLAVSIPEHASAKEIAAALNDLPGVKSSARTQIELSGLVEVPGGTPLELTVNGTTLSGFTDLGELADTINANPALSDANITAVLDGPRMTLTASDGADISLHFQGDPSESIVLTNQKGETQELRGSVLGSYSSATVGGEVQTILDPGLTMRSDLTGIYAAAPLHARADLGFDAVLTGNVMAGDRFELNFNSGGVADNRNALAMAGLDEKALVGDPPRTFSGTYGGLIQSLGIQSAQAQINRDAAESLLAQSEAFRESISGVNLDEEAANLIRHEQAYNASAQVISVARDIFNVLLDSVT